MSEERPFKIAGKSGSWEIVIGLEVHAQVSSNLKLFLMDRLALVAKKMKT